MKQQFHHSTYYFFCFSSFNIPEEFINHNVYPKKGKGITTYYLSTSSAHLHCHKGVKLRLVYTVTRGRSGPLQQDRTMLSAVVPCHYILPIQFLLSVPTKSPLLYSKLSTRPRLKPSRKIIKKHNNSLEYGLTQNQLVVTVVSPINSFQLNQRQQ